jgi:23S rRNA C2498 (ribose-2'-O)-methylase RlmM
MQAEPKRFLHNGGLDVMWDQRRHGIWMTCEVVGPKSRVGQKVHVHLNEDDCVKLLLELRNHALWERSAE